ncbi:glycoside hydrolase family 3 protein [Streptosporangium sp. NBC_01756]|uniref:glycoside hydrolase family 3 protein n=1 Tax=Streptosporangium sp. NBC_01756 TaxID=2975950 RepID=UPI002DDB41DF|nr:glycoside hydrolase family 3 N-terminal domain-containing protein [Streptosporangium sp. NBC_01756]WSC86871.1 glycoside hydrolase family 3 protein [Streptosporangium sp. NBC_01756]
MSHSSPHLDRLAMTVLQPGFDGTAPPDWLRRALADGLGGAVLFARNLTDRAQTAELVAGLRRENPAVVVAVDEEGGAVTRLEARTGSSWPGNRALGVADDTGRTERVAREIGLLLAAADITLDYAPVVDVNANPANPVIGIRSFGPDPDLVSRQGVAWIAGLQSTGVAACAKHFPGHGDTVTDSHHALPTVHASPELLRERDLPPFHAAVRAGVQAVMCGHLLVPSLDPDSPATLSRPILTGLLREEMGFDGLLVTDAIEMGAVAALHPPGEIAVRALAAGVDAICVGTSSPGGESVYALRDAIVTAVLEGRLPEERLAQAAARVLALAAWHAEHPARKAEPSRDTEEGAELGMETARAAMRVVVAADHPASPSGHERGGRPAGHAPRVPAPSSPAISRPPLVVDIAPRLNLAIDPGVPTGLIGALTELLPGTAGQTVTAETARLPDISDDGRPLVLVVHDAGRHTWVRDLLAQAVRLRPDAIVVETGMPGEPTGAIYLATHGISRVSARAVALWLVGGQ